MGAIPIAFDTSSCLQKKWTFLMACTHSVRTPLTWKNQTHLRTRDSESTTSVGQYLDTDFNFLFKDKYANIFTTEVEPKLKGKGLSARDRRVLVTRIVAKAHSLTISAGNAKQHEVFKKTGLSCLCPRWFLFLARSVESPRWFLFLGRFLVWGMFLFLGRGFRWSLQFDAVEDCNQQNNGPLAGDASADQPTLYVCVHTAQRNAVSIITINRLPCVLPLVGVTWESLSAAAYNSLCSVGTKLMKKTVCRPSPADLDCISRRLGLAGCT